ncbi:PREDICTED: probable G-protein coupled receptor 157 [Myotis brandtii]|uniref:probable G-protein coupled receptor 157 n=1 Tax=Myotis brandtii TaxID=109478 RepID=UPI000703E521|nr:PREDICTED: probable G-protein coupled receptor 157 [Myotis brandtii]
MCPPKAQIPFQTLLQVHGPWTSLPRQPQAISVCTLDPGCWGVPLAITVAAVILKKIGYDASDVSVGWCWIDLEAKDRVLWMLLTGKLWELLAYVMLPVLYLLSRVATAPAAGLPLSSGIGGSSVQGEGAPHFTAPSPASLRPGRTAAPGQLRASVLLTPLWVFPAQHQALSEYRPILSEAHRLQHHSSMADKKLVLIPVIFICLRVWSTVRFVLTLCGSPAVRAPVLVVLHVGSFAHPSSSPPAPLPCCSQRQCQITPLHTHRVSTSQCIRQCRAARGLGSSPFLPPARDREPG